MSLENSIKQETTIKSQSGIVFRCIAVGLGGFLYGYVLSELTILSGVLDIKIQHYNKLQTAFVGIMSLGACLVCLVSDYLVNKYGRRNYIIASDIIFLFGILVGTIFVALIDDNFYILLVARFIMGIAIGMNSNVVSMYIREISPESISGQNGSIFQIQINIGIISGIALNFANDYGKYYVQANLCPTDNTKDYPQCQEIVNSHWWVFVIAFPALFSLMRLIILLVKYKLDTPYYYFSVEKFQEGIEILKELYKEKYVLNECQNILATFPKKVRASYIAYRNKQQQQQDKSIDDQVNQIEDDSQGNQKNVDITSNSNLNYDNDDDYFNEQNNQYPLEGVDIYSNSQLEYNCIQDLNDIQESFTQKAKEQKQKSLYKRMRRGMILNLFQQLTGINYIIQYTSTILKNILSNSDNFRVNQEFSYFSKNSNILTEIVLLSNIFLLMAAFVGSFLNKSFGRRYYLFGGYLICGFLHCIFAIISYQYRDSQGQTFQAIFIIVFVFVFYGTFNCSIGPVTWIYTSDILKGKYLFWSVGCNWFGVFLASLLQLNDNYQYQYINFSLFSFFCFIGAVYSYYKIIETEGKRYFEIIKEYAE
ncbi:MFS transporter (macronuclear) [Tetrahymena thermophila SB210]|uniref:Hexose transporter 1 n=1 Tax=Tetrahymena thermophila (strain SB210) TaxID=312017 RepID=I7MF55_TETTS|nr:MFS transporter [Tetrahymena thermophila SB210]EAR99359.1 MFS transporter [Tetrahymena thermophila SB210]|eukprot:XP_001019604.1 MFS transporter [Tetrahymena thermophila SB210]